MRPASFANSFVLAVALLPLAGLTAAHAQERPEQAAGAASASGEVEFARDLLPVLQRKCLACHSQTNAQSDVLLESADAIRAAQADDVPVIVPGDAANSRLFQLASGAAEPRMPPPDNDVNAAPLTDAELALLRKWIDAGAKAAESSHAAAIDYQPLPPGVHPIYAASMTPDGRFAAYALANQIRVLHVPSRTEVTRLSDPQLISSGLYTKPGMAHADTIDSLAWSDDGRWLASGSFHTLKLWRRRPPVRVARFGAADEPAAAKLVDLAELQSGHTPSAPLFLPQAADQFLTANDAGVVTLWALAHPDQAVRTFNHGAALRQLTLDAAGKRLVTIGTDDRVLIWDIASGETVGQIFGDPRRNARREELALALARADAVLAARTDALNQAASERAASESNLAKAAEALTAAESAVAAATQQQQSATTAREAIQTRQAAAAQAHEQAKLAQDALAKALAAAPGDATLKQAQADLQQAIQGLTTSLEAAKAELEAAERDLATVTAALTAAQSQHSEAQSQRDAAQANLKRLAQQITERETQKATVAAEQEAASAQLAAADEQLKQPVGWRAAAISRPATDAAQRPLLALVTMDGGVLIFDLPSGSLLDSIAADAHPATGVAFVDDHQLLLTDASGGAALWDVAQQFELVRVIDANSPAGPVDRVTALAFSPDGMLLASGGGEPSRGGELKLWNVASGALEREIADPHTDAVLCLAFSPDGHTLASGSADRLVKILDVATGDVMHAMEGHTAHVLGLDWRFDGLVLASCGADQAVKVWDADTGEAARSMDALTGKQLTALRYVQSSPERGLTSDDLLITAGDGRVLVRRGASGQGLREVQASDDFLYALDCDRTGRLVIVGGQDGIVRLIDAVEGQTLWQAADVK